MLVAAPEHDRTDTHHERTGGALLKSAAWFAATPQGRAHQTAFDLAWVPLLNPDAGPDAADGGRSAAFPPAGTAYQEAETDLEHYDRTAILGVDERGGAMALLLATEVAGWWSGPAGGGGG